MVGQGVALAVANSRPMTHILVPGLLLALTAQPLPADTPPLAGALRRLEIRIHNIFYANRGAEGSCGGTAVVSLAGLPMKCLFPVSLPKAPLTPTAAAALTRMGLARSAWAEIRGTWASAD